MTHPTRIRPKRLATLTPEEDRRWQQLFADYGNHGNSDAAADRLAWEDLKLEYPRLAAFDGCKP